jgi:DNA-binding transcriptional LysR family regulator
MDLRQLEYVLAVSEELNFTRAAERCHIAQSALSHQIARLEKELGSRLFERSSRSVRVTEAGEALAATARQILDSVGLVRSEIDAIGGLTRGRLAIGATQTALRALDVVAVFGEFHHRHPDVELTLALGPMNELAAGVSAGTHDLALGHCNEPLQRPLRVERLIERVPLVAVVAAGGPLTGRKSVRVAELAALGPLIEFRGGLSPRTEVDALFRSARVRRRIAFELGQHDEMVRCAAHGLGAAIVPAPFAEPRDPRLPAFDVFAIRDAGASIAVDAVCPTNPASPALLAFLALLRER